MLIQWGTKYPFKCLKNLFNSGVATGWHGWTMSRGPGAKGPPERETKKKKMKTRKEKKGRKEKKKKEKKRESETFQIPGRGPTRYISMSLSTKIKSNIGNHHTILEI